MFAMHCRARQTLMGLRLDKSFLMLWIISLMSSLFALTRTEIKRYPWIQKKKYTSIEQYYSNFNHLGNRLKETENLAHSSYSWTCISQSLFSSNIKPLINGYLSKSPVSPFITPILKSLVVLVIWLALIGVIYSWIAPIFALNRIFFPGNEEAILKMKWPIRFQGLFKVTDQIAEKWKTEYHVANSVSKTLTPPPPPKKKMDEFNFSPAQYCINKMFEMTKSCIWAISKWMW